MFKASCDSSKKFCNGFGRLAAIAGKSCFSQFHRPPGLLFSSAVELRIERLVCCRIDCAKCSGPCFAHVTAENVAAMKLHRFHDIPNGLELNSVFQFVKLQLGYAIAPIA